MFVPNLGQCVYGVNVHVSLILDNKLKNNKITKYMGNTARPKFYFREVYIYAVGMKARILPCTVFCSIFSIRVADR